MSWLQIQHDSLSMRDTEEGIYMIKSTFQHLFSKGLNLLRVTSPLFVQSGDGINDDLNGVEKPVSFNIRGDDSKIEIVHSLAKWKRIALKRFGMEPGHGVLTDMNAIRADETLDEIHSVYVDQWDWERAIRTEDRSLDFLKNTVKQIYQVLKDTEITVCKEFPVYTPVLPNNITFIHSQDLEDRFPDLTPQQRENAVCREHGAVFLIGIGGALKSGRAHDGRAADYDDWSTQSSPGHYGLNGDILLWNSTLGRAYEISSMGVRVDQSSLLRQLMIRGEESKKSLLYHRMILSNTLPLSIGGGIGQSRLCMFFLRKQHIGQVQSSVWPETMRRELSAKGINLL